MATVNKDFKIKSGLIVEGTNGTINGSDIITEDALTGGTQTNITVSYDPQTKLVSFVAENGVADSTTDDLTEGSSNLYFTDARAKDSAAALLTNATLTNITITGTGNDGLVITAENGVADSTTDDLDEGSTNLYFTDERAQDAVGNNVGGGLKYDDASGAISVKTGAETPGGDGGAIEVDGTSGNIKVRYDNNTIDSAGSANYLRVNTNVIASKVYVGDLIGDATVDGTSGNTITDRIATAVADLVDGAPALLDTLNELAAAINDDASFSTTITTSIGTKVSKAGDTMTGALVLHADPVNALEAATKQYVDTAEADAVSAANDYTDTAISTLESGLPTSTDGLAEGTTNLYYTNARARAAVSAEANGPLTYNSGTGVFDLSIGNGLTQGISAELKIDDTVVVTHTDLDGYLNSETGTTVTELQEYVDTAIETGDATATPTYLALDINSVAKQVAAQVNASTANVEVTAYSFTVAAYKSAKFLVHVVPVMSGGPKEVSEILLTVDGLSNIAITEYAVVSTDGSLASITADLDPEAPVPTVRLRVTPVNNNSLVTVYGTLLA